MKPVKEHLYNMPISEIMDKIKLEDISESNLTEEPKSVVNVKKVEAKKNIIKEEKQIIVEDKEQNNVYSKILSKLK